MIRLTVILVFTACFLSGCTGQAPSTSVFTDAIEYTDIPNFENCTESPVKEVRYYACKNSRDIYKAALMFAREQGKPLMVTFGFNTCPYCKVLDMEIYNPRKPVTVGDVTQYLSSEAAEGIGAFTLPTVRIHARSEHGLKLADELGVTRMAQARGWHRVWSPFVVFVNPNTGTMASESLWEAAEVYCEWSANIAVSLEKNGFVKRGKPQVQRKRCPKM